MSKTGQKPYLQTYLFYMEGTKGTHADRHGVACPDGAVRDIALGGGSTAGQASRDGGAM